jgi:integrase/recombinase XerC
MTKDLPEVKGNFIHSVFKLKERDILAELLADKRSQNTRRAYERDLTDFFLNVAESSPSPELLQQFLTVDRFTAIGLVLQYKAGLIEKGLKEATINRRLAAIKALVRYAQKIGKCEWSLEEIQGEKVKKYRDTSGVDLKSFQKILKSVDKRQTKGLRDFAILHLLWSNALRRNEVVSANYGDYNQASSQLWITGKGRGTQKEKISLGSSTNLAIAAWLETREAFMDEDPLFIALNPQHYGSRITGDTVADIVSKYAKKAGINKQISPHRIRHSAITHALDATKGDVRKVQKLSRHAKIETLLIYDDNRIDFQGEVSTILSDSL